MRKRQRVSFPGETLSMAARSTALLFSGCGKVCYLRMTFEEVTKDSGRIKRDLTDNAEGQFLLSSFSS
jgi:hypothetical protein